MDKYRVGQRVMVLYCNSVPELNGETVTITEQRRERTRKIFPFETWVGYKTDAEVELDGVKSFFCPREEQLAPIDDGWQKTTWDQCAWRPQQFDVRVTGNSPWESGDKYVYVPPMIQGNIANGTFKLYGVRRT